MQEAGNKKTKRKSEEFKKTYQPPLTSISWIQKVAFINSTICTRHDSKTVIKNTDLKLTPNIHTDKEERRGVLYVEKAFIFILVLLLKKKN